MRLGLPHRRGAVPAVTREPGRAPLINSCPSCSRADVGAGDELRGLLVHPALCFTLTLEVASMLLALVVVVAGPPPTVAVSRDAGHLSVPPSPAPGPCRGTPSLALLLPSVRPSSAAP